MAAAACAVALFGAAGLAIDIGRMYITKTEAQSYADAAAVSAVIKLNGTAAGLIAADAAVDAIVHVCATLARADTAINPATTTNLRDMFAPWIGWAGVARQLV